MVLEKTLESPLDCKEIKPVNLKGNECWIFIGRTDAKAEAPPLWPPDVKNWLIRKDPDAGKYWRLKEKGMAEDVDLCHYQLDGREFEQAPFQFSSVAQSCPTLQPHGLQHTKLPCPSPTPRACSNSWPSSRWCHVTTSSSVVPFYSCLRSFPTSGSFPMSQLFTSGGQSIGASASASILPMNIQDWFPLGQTGLISLQSKALSRVFSNTQFKSINFLALSFLYRPTFTSRYDYWKNHSFD